MRLHMRVASVAICANVLFSLCQNPGAAAQTPTARQAPSAAQSTYSFSGQNIPLFIGSAAGGTVDLIGRLVAKYLREELPGNPVIVPQNLPGAGGLLAANYVLKKDAPPGPAIASIFHLLTLQQAVGNSHQAFDLRDVNWLGSIASFPAVCVVRTSTGVATIQDAMKREVALAGGSAGTGQNIFPLTLNATIGTKFKLVRGYAGIADAFIAVERGEVDGMCLGTVKRFLDWIQSGLARPVLVLGKVPDSQKEWAAALNGVPSVEDLLQKAANRDLIEAVLAPWQIVYGYGLNKDAPPAEVAVMRAAFTRMLNNPEFSDAITQQGEIFAPHTADEVETIVKSILSLPPDRNAELKRIMEQ